MTKVPIRDPTPWISLGLTRQSDRSSSSSFSFIAPALTWTVFRGGEIETVHWVSKGSAIVIYKDAACAWLANWLELNKAKCQLHLKGSCFPFKKWWFPGVLN